MSYPFPPDLVELVAERMSTGAYGSEDDLLRDALRALSEEEEDLLAVREAITEMEAGDPGIPLAEAFQAIREKYSIPRDR
jgi:putative addiction module CopG family antidote